MGLEVVDYNLCEYGSYVMKFLIIVAHSSLLFFPGKHCREKVLLYTLQVSRESRTSWDPRTTRLKGVIQLQMVYSMGLSLVGVGLRLSS